MKALVLLNAEAGTLAALRLQEEVERIRQALGNARLETEIRLVPGEKMAQAAQAARTSQAELVIAGGGDGTLNTVARQLLDSGKTFGILPLGTMNHLAKELAIPLDLDQALEVIVRGKAQALTVGEVNGHPFLLFSALGLYSNIIKHRDTQRRVLGRNRWLAMAIAFFKALRRFPLLRVRLRIGGHSFWRLTPLVLVSLSDYQVQLLGIQDYTCPGRRAMSLCLARSTGRLGLLGTLGRALLGLPLPPAALEAMCVEQELEIATRHRHLRVGIDGEVIDLPAPLVYRLRPGALKVILP